MLVNASHTMSSFCFLLMSEPIPAEVLAAEPARDHDI
jgi:hypothetical protein